MHRLRFALIVGILAAAAPGCGGENQPNAAAKPEDVKDPAFINNTTDMMKQANTGMDPKAAKTGAPKK